MQMWRERTRTMSERTKDLDPLWRAACLEATARELASLGLSETADRVRDQATALLAAFEGEKRRNP